MSRAIAAERYPRAEPDMQSREVIDLPALGEALGNSRPPDAK